MTLSLSEVFTVLDQSTIDAAIAFRRARDWEQFHSPRNLAIAIVVESAELLEHFQWMKEGEQRPAEAHREAVEMEMADIAMLLTYLATDLGVDMNAAVSHKLAINETRYPVEKARGSSAKYDAL